MIEEFEVENYRGFKSFKLEGLTTVNLLVGKNNSGKTALLESIYMLASGGELTVLADAAMRRGESISEREEVTVDISHLFHGHKIESNSYFSVRGGNGFSPLTVRVQAAEEAAEEPELFEDSLRNSPPPYILIVEGAREPPGARPVFVSDDGAMVVSPRLMSRRRVLQDSRREGPTIVFITPDSMEPISVGMMWNQVLKEKQEGEIKKAMQILEKDLEDIVFQTTEGYRGYKTFLGRSGVLVSFAGDKRRVPLGSMGDGMRRLLALALSLNHATNGILIIDEIDTGFHYSIMSKMWELLVVTARRSNIQIFATTHSADCVRGLGLLCKENADLEAAVSAHKIERNFNQSIVFSGNDVVSAIENDIEIR